MIVIIIITIKKYMDIHTMTYYEHMHRKHCLYIIHSFINAWLSLSLYYLIITWLFDKSRKTDYHYHYDYELSVIIWCYQMLEISLFFYSKHQLFLPVKNVLCEWQKKFIFPPNKHFKPQSHQQQTGKALKLIS